MAWNRWSEYYPPRAAGVSTSARTRTTCSVLAVAPPTRPRHRLESASRSHLELRQGQIMIPHNTVLPIYLPSAIRAVRFGECDKLRWTVTARERRTRKGRG